MLYDDYEGSRGEFLKLLAEQGEEPAFLRRSRLVDQAIDRMHRECNAQRETMLRWPRLHLHQLALMIHSDWSKLSTYLIEPRQFNVLETLHQTWSAQSPPKSWASAGRWSRPIRGELNDFYGSVSHFNQAWTEFLAAYDLGSLNNTIEGYNEHYPLEKACAVGSEDIARLGFQPRERLTRQQLQREFPPLSLPPLRA